MNWYGFINAAARLRHAISTRLYGPEKPVTTQAEAPSLDEIDSQLVDRFSPASVDNDLRSRMKSELLNAYHARMARKSTLQILMDRIRARAGDERLQLFAAALITSLIGSIIAALLTYGNKRSGARAQS